MNRQVLRPNRGYDVLIPLYGFLEGDTIGLLILADEQETVQSLADKLQEAASIRVARRTQVQVMYKSRVMDPKLTLAQAGFEPLERVDVVHKEG
jgi:hypothetical protein